MTDIVQRLRERREVFSSYSGTGRVSLVRGIAADPLCREAADEIERLRALSAPAAPSVPQWQPIETAPKGRILLVDYTNRAGKWRTVRGRYYEAETLDSEVSDDGWAPEGWYEEADNAEEINFTDEPPTHWMPLPAAPQPGAPTPTAEGE